MNQVQTPQEVARVSCPVDSLGMKILLLLQFGKEGEKDGVQILPQEKGLECVGSREKALRIAKLIILHQSTYQATLLQSEGKLERLNSILEKVEVIPIPESLKQDIQGILEFQYLIQYRKQDQIEVNRLLGKNVLRLIPVEKSSDLVHRYQDLELVRRAFSRKVSLENSDGWIIVQGIQLEVQLYLRHFADLQSQRKLSLFQSRYMARQLDLERNVRPSRSSPQARIKGEEMEPK